jgi:hypothetical protein
MGQVVVVGLDIAQSVFQVDRRSGPAVVEAVPSAVVVSER